MEAKIDAVEYSTTLKVFIEHKLKMREHLLGCFGLVLNLSAKTMKHCLINNNSNYDDISIEGDIIQLLKHVKRIMYNMSKDMYPLHTTNLALINHINCYQKEQDLGTYKNTFNVAVAMYVHN